MRQIIFTLLLTLLLASSALAGEQKRQGSYLRFSPPKNLTGESRWNYWITEQGGKLKSRSFYRYPDSRVLPKEGLWNPLINIPSKKNGKKNGK